VNQPAFAHAVFRKPCDSFFRFANPRIWRQHFHHQVRRATHPIPDDRRILIGDEHQIGLDDQRPFLVENHVERREPDLSDAVRANVAVKRSKDPGHCRLMPRRRGLRDSQDAEAQLRRHDGLRRAQVLVNRHQLRCSHRVRAPLHDDDDDAIV